MLQKQNQSGLTWKELHDLVLFARRKLREEQLPQVAGSLTFTTVLALVPLLTIVFAIFTNFPMFDTFRSSLEAYFVQSVMPKGIANTIVSNLTTFANKATRLSAVGAVALLITSTAMMGMIERAFNRIWRVKRPRPLQQRILVYWALVTLGPLMIGLSLTVTSHLFMATSGWLSRSAFLSAFLTTLVSVGLTSAAFTMLYVAVPNRVVAWRDAAWGGLVAALAFEIAKRVFAVFIQQVPTYAIIYGALAALPLFLLWVYTSWMITLVGALLAAALPVVKYERWWYEPQPGGEFADAMSILQVLYRASKADNALVTSADIRHHTRIGYDEMGTLLDQMVEKGWVGRVLNEAPKRKAMDNWVLLSNPDKVTLAEVYRLFVFGGIVGHDALARHVEAAVEQGLQQTLSQHFTSAAREGK